jgi:ArsR family transcriptional regulator, lead/cadmium/zinc/bismuth-responsive transcriptional repressor
MSAKNIVAYTATNSLPNTEDIHNDSKQKIDSDNVQPLENWLISNDKAQRMAEFFSFLGDANRLRILCVLAKEELCVSDLAASLEMSESAVSHQLRNLRAMRLVGYRKQGRNVFYRLHDSHVFHLYQAVAEHLDEKDEG